jgi:uncharacterized protein with HEPN domain
VSPRNWEFRIEDILESLELISEYVEGLDYDNWKKDRKTIDAVIRNIEIIGEAANHIPMDIQEKYIDIPWYEMKGMRNILIHEYFGVDIDVLWRTIQEDLPPLKVKIQKIISSNAKPHTS